VVILLVPTYGIGIYSKCLQQIERHQMRSALSHVVHFGDVHRALPNGRRDTTCVRKVVLEVGISKFKTGQLNNSTRAQPLAKAVTHAKHVNTPLSNMCMTKSVRK
jgi:hypothetical protein